MSIMVQKKPGPWPENANVLIFQKRVGVLLCHFELKLEF